MRSGTTGRNCGFHCQLPYKCLFDLHLHKLFLVERLKYVREMFGFEENFDTLISRIEEVAKLYERMNMLNMKYNMRDKIPPYILSQNLEFKEKLASLLIQAFEIETSTIPQIIACLNQIINNQYENNMDDFLIEYSDNGIILRPCFDEYVQQFSICIASVINHELPVQIQMSNGYVYYSSDSDYADGQRINQWEYCYYENGEEKYLEYDKNENTWKADNGNCLGVDFQNATHEIMVSRNWKCPSAGQYQIIFTGESDVEDSVTVNATQWTKEYLACLNSNQTPSDVIAYRYRHPDIKNALEAETHGKCAYCESTAK